MAPIHVSIDPLLIEGCLLLTIGIVAATVGAIAAIAVVHERRSQDSPTKAAEEVLLVRANPVSVTVGGGSRMSDPLDLHFILTDPAVTLLRIELANPLDKGASTAPCVKAAPEVFIAEVDPKVVVRWYNANGYWKGETKKLPICLLFTVGGYAGCRTIWVAVSPIKAEISGLSDDMNFAWCVEGPCPRPLLTPAANVQPHRHGETIDTTHGWPTAC